MRNSRAADKGKEIVETMTVPYRNNDVEDNDGIADMPLPCLPTVRHTALLTSLRWLEAQNDFDPVRLQLAHRLYTAERGDETIYKTYAAPLNKFL